MNRIILQAPAENLNGSIQDILSPDQRVQFAGHGLGRKIRGKGLENLALYALLFMMNPLVIRPRIFTIRVMFKAFFRESRDAV
ncbi:MAG: hypothetical protein A4E72_00389 [Syntrophus sp. PtaU1.Bin208]|nr:MAG: hypothetical protein A4E72_00389 [Syntrophus sp. PtaU1.Bin208]